VGGQRTESRRSGRRYCVSRRSFAVAIAALVAATASGCAANTPIGPTHVNLSLVAPTDGATVFVRQIVVFGHVNPSHARVLVAGRQATVHKGTFRVRMQLPRSVNRIGIVATANGYLSTSLATTVRVSDSGSTAPARPAPRSRSREPALPSDFVTRAEKICSAAAQQIAALPIGTQQTFASVWRRHIAIRRTANRELIALMSPAARLPAVQTFVKDLHTMVAIDVGILNDLLQGRDQAAIHVYEQPGALAPQWWQDAGRLGVPDCGATWHHG
jgi:hypothetical protein